MKHSVNAAVCFYFSCDESASPKVQSLKSVDYNAGAATSQVAAHKLAVERCQALTYSRAGIEDKSRLHRAHVASPD
jgi:hypothetical protein